MKCRRKKAPVHLSHEEQVSMLLYAKEEYGVSDATYYEFSRIALKFTSKTKGQITQQDVDDKSYI